jgi:hypothetical protein
MSALQPASTLSAPTISPPPTGSALRSSPIGTAQTFRGGAAAEVDASTALCKHSIDSTMQAQQVYARTARPKPETSKLTKGRVLKTERDLPSRQKETCQGCTDRTAEMLQGRMRLSKPPQEYPMLKSCHEPDHCANEYRCQTASVAWQTATTACQYCHMSYGMRIQSCMSSS